MAATYDIVSIGETDASALTRIGYKAFADDLLNLRLYNLQDATPSQIENDLQWRIQRNEKRMYGPGGHWFKAINTATGKAVGYCGILAPEKGKPKGLDTTDDTIKLPETMNQDLWAVVGAKGKELREQHMGNRDDYWYVPSMAVDPDYHGQGIAKRLLQKLCEIADEAGQDIYLESTTAARTLYKNAGFEVLGELVILDGEYLLTSMLRKSGKLI